MNNYFNQFGQPNYNNYSNMNRVSQTNTNKIYVNSIQDVYNYQMPANADFIFVNNNENVLYRKVTDNFGKFAVDAFNLVPVTQSKPDYVTRDEFDNLQKEIVNLKEYLPKVNTSNE